MEDILNTCIIVAIPIAAVAWFVARRRRAQRRDARLAASWVWAQELGRSAGTALVQVNHVYQRARTGSKAYVRWPNGYIQDTWFARFQAVGGCWIVLSGNTSYGPHNHNPNVLYVDPQRVRSVLPPDAPAACARHNKRVERRAQSGTAERSRRLAWPQSQKAAQHANMTSPENDVNRWIR